MTQLAYRKVYTSAEVYAVIRARHSHEMSVFGTISQPDGDPFGDPDDCCMVTEWGIKGHDTPLIGIETRWIKSHDGKHSDGKSTYWLCSATEPME